MTSPRRVLLIGLVNIVIMVLLFFLLEGAASSLFIAHEIVTTPAVPEHQHAEHDNLLGWVNRPDVDLPDFYGPGIGVRTNAQRFRNNRPFPQAVPAGRIRIICSGDSFTFGYAVANDEAWCERLTDLDTRIETVNMGLGGYGVDQAYLWYMRDGTRLDHDLHLFAFLTDDFRRMRSDRFMGYGKPLLLVRNDSLTVANAPVPRTSWLARRRALHGEAVSRLNVVRLTRKLLRLDGAGAAERDSVRTAAEDARVREVVAHILANLRRANVQRGSHLVLVFLPGSWDYGNDAETDSWRRYIQEEAARQDIVFFDLVEELRSLPPTGVDSLYGPHSHFTPAGNAWAAAVLYRRLAPLLDRAADDADRRPGAPASEDGIDERRER